MTKRHYPPSRIRYEREHPTITFRCQDRKEYEYIRATAEQLGMSISQLVRPALLKRMKECKGVYERGYWNGYKDGFQKAALLTIKKFAPNNLCLNCGRFVLPEDDNARFYLTRSGAGIGLHHTNCQAAQTLTIEDEYAKFEYTLFPDPYTKPRAKVRLKHSHGGSD